MLTFNALPLTRGRTPGWLPTQRLIGSLRKVHLRMFPLGSIRGRPRMVRALVTRGRICCRSWPVRAATPRLALGSRRHFGGLLRIPRLRRTGLVIRGRIEDTDKTRARRSPLSRMTPARIGASCRSRLLTPAYSGARHRARRLLLRLIPGHIRGSCRMARLRILAAILDRRSCRATTPVAPGLTRVSHLTRGRIGWVRPLTLGLIVSLARPRHRHRLTRVHTGGMPHRLTRLCCQRRRWLRRQHMIPRSKFVRRFYLMAVGPGLRISCRRLPARWVDPTRPRLQRRHLLRRVTKLYVPKDRSLRR